MSDRQTLSFLSQKMGAAHLRPKLQFGQNFLIDLNLLDLIVRTAELDSRDVVLEVGTGVGSLTSRIADQAGHVVTVEIDRDLAKLAQDELTEYSNVTLLQIDALKNKNHMSEEVLEAVREAMSRIPDARLKLVANLPYSIATPILSNLLTVDPVPALMVATIQKELAYRIIARPRTKDYSALSIWMQSNCECELIREMSPKVFWPRPKVESAILRIAPNSQLRERITDLDFFHQTVRAIFCHRRKFLRSGLQSAFKNVLDKPAIDRVLTKLGYANEARAEELDIENMIKLVEACRLECKSIQL